MFELSCLLGVSRVGWANNDDDVACNDVIIQLTFWTRCYIKAQTQSEQQVQFDSVCCLKSTSWDIPHHYHVEAGKDVDSYVSHSTCNIKLYYLCVDLSCARHSSRSGYGGACPGSGCGTQPGPQSAAVLLCRIPSCRLCISLLLLWLSCVPNLFVFFLSIRKKNKSWPGSHSQYPMKRTKVFFWIHKK